MKNTESGSGKKYTLENVGIGTELDKRFTLDGVVLYKKCKCGNIMEKDLEGGYLSYPCVGYPEKLYLYCENCEEEYEEALKVTVRINLEVEEL